ncbi:lasso peptide biosynthesis PqqD family chaperone [Streptomyces sp. PRKS01-65]|nr:lasso peptide biosynthesis PqqD family chaperone [Streptomyces harenosi]NEY34060.1 lasso peptide biosynthesis PqqD family chaperone [Streptomyces harenosi]
MTHSLAPDVSATPTDDGMVLLQETTGRYWMLNPTGAEVVRLLGQGRDAAGIAEELGARFPGQSDRVAADVAALLGHLVRARLVTP